MRNVFFQATTIVSIALFTTGELTSAHAGVLLDNTTAGIAPLAADKKSTFDGVFRMGVVFKANQSVTLSSLTVGLSNGFGTTGNIALYKLASATTNPNSASGGNLLSSVSTGFLSQSTTPRYVTFSIASMPTLETGQHYAMILQEFTNTSTGNYVQWHRSDPQIALPDTASIDFINFKHTFNNSVWYDTLASEYNSFYLQGTPSGASVPEPMTIALAGLGASTFVATQFLRRRRAKSSFTA